MATLDIPLWQINVAMAIGLLGVYVGWRGGMRRMVGFYDMPAATRLLLFGFFFGALYQVAAIELVMRPLWTGHLPPVVPALLVGVAISLATMFLLTRESVRRLNGQPTAGWAFGLGLGAMMVGRLLIEMIAFPEGLGNWIRGFTPEVLILGAGLAVLVPWTEAILCSWQGWHALHGSRFLPLVKAGLIRSMLFFVLAFGVVYPFALLLLPAFVLWGQRQADAVWLPSGLSPRMKQEWTRLQRTGIATGVRAVAFEEE